MKRIVAKTGKYTKNGEEKNEWTKIGVILEKDGNEFILFDPSVNMAGIAYKQRVNGIAKPDSDTVIASIFTDENQAQNAPQDAHNQAKSDGYAPQADEFNDDIPF